VSDRITEQTTLCVYCPKMCRVACPIAEASGREEVTPWSLMTLLAHVRDGRLALDAEIATLFHQCTGCGRCKTFCAHENDVPTALHAGRQLAAHAGLVPRAALAAVDRVRHTGNVKGENLAARQRELLGDRVGADAKTLFFAGDDALSSGAQGLVDAVKVLEHLGYGPIALLEDAPSDGSPFYDAGLDAEFRDYAKGLAEKLSRYSLVVSSDAGAVFTFRERFPTVGAVVRARVAHFSELALERMPKGAPLELRAVYHDPDALGRALGVYDAPRELLRRAGVEVLEFFDRKESSRSAGTGFGFERFDPAIARSIAERRVEDVPARADVIATSDPASEAALRAVSSKPVVDVATLLARSLGLSQPA